MVVLHLILKSLARTKGLYLLWIASIALTVAGLLIVDVYRESLSETLRQQGRAILAADLTLSARRPLKPEEIERFKSAFGPEARFTRSTEMLAMVSGPSASHLAGLNFIEDEFPLIGALEITGDRSRTEPQLWASEDFLPLTGFQVGDGVKVGKLDLKLSGVIARDTTQTFRFGAMAPRVYLNRKFLALSGLVQEGSTLTDTIRVLVPVPPLDLAKRVEELFPDPTLQITTTEDLRQGSLRVLGRLLDFLGLVGLVGLSLGWVGIYFLAQRWLQNELVSVGILKAQGLRENWLSWFLRFKLLTILALGAACGGLLAWWGARALFGAVKESLPAEFVLTWSWTNTSILLLVGPLSGLLLLWNSIRRTAEASPLDLIRSRWTSAFGWRAGLLTGLVCGSLFVLLTFLESRSWKVTGLFIACLFAALILMSALGLGILRPMVAGLRARKNWISHLAASLWMRRQTVSLLLVVVSGMAGLLAQLIPNLERTFLKELQAPEGLNRPALFMFDIQDSQVKGVEDLLRSIGTDSSQKAPFIRARILTVNGAAFERAQTGSWSTREEEMEARFRNRGVNLSYRAEFSDYDQILEGKSWEETSADPSDPEISVEEAYAGRVGLKIGDRVEFDIEGAQVIARVASLRKVDWNSFQPAFFIQFKDGVLNDAPKTWIMTVKESANLTPVEIQTRVTREFPNVTSVNVRNTIANVTEIFGKLSSGLRVAALLSLGLGIFVFLIVLFFQLASSERDWIQLRVLGARDADIMRLQIVTYGGLCLAGGILGAILSVAMTWILGRYAFEVPVVLNPTGSLRALGLTVASVFGTILLRGWLKPLWTSRTDRKTL